MRASMCIGRVPAQEFPQANLLFNFAGDAYRKDAIRSGPTAYGSLGSGDIVPGQGYGGLAPATSNGYVASAYTNPASDFLFVASLTANEASATTQAVLKIETAAAALALQIRTFNGIIRVNEYGSNLFVDGPSGATKVACGFQNGLMRYSFSGAAVTTGGSVRPAIHTASGFPIAAWNAENPYRAGRVKLIALCVGTFSDADIQSFSTP